MSLWDIYQHVQIKNVQVSQRLVEQEQRFRDRRHEHDIDHMEDRLREITTVLEALWTLCRDKLGLTDDQLTAAVQAVVEEQQAEAAAGPVKCPSCGAAIGAELERCQFCGTESPRIRTAFDKL